MKVYWRDKSEQYSEFHERKSKAHKEKTLNLLNSLELDVAADPDNENLNNRLFIVKQKLEVILIYEAKMAGIRAGVKWVQESEKK